MDSSKTTAILVILAGGKSSRMGSPKGLLDFKGKPWILAQLEGYTDVNNATAYIGLGFDAAYYFEQIAWFEEAAQKGYNYQGIWVRVIVNDHPEKGPFSTLLSVVLKLPDQQSILVLPIDVPLVSKNELAKLLADESPVVIPVYKDKKGHPVKLSAKVCEKILNIDVNSVEARLDTQIAKLPPSSIKHLSVTDAEVILNINRPEDWKNYLKLG